MDNKTGQVIVDVGTPPSGLGRWESVRVCFHGFADLQAVESPEFTCCGHQWNMQIYPGGDDLSDDGMVAVYLCNMSNESISIAFLFSVRDPAGIEVASFAAEGTDFAPRDQEQMFSEDDSDCHGQLNFAKRSTILDALEKGTLSIEVQMKLIDHTNIPLHQYVPENPICKYILGQFMDEESADVILELEVGSGSRKGGNSRKRTKTSTKTIFRAHSLILKGGAPALAELCKPGRGNVISVSITDVKADIFRHLLYYAYGGKVAEEELKANARDIIDAADKYGVVSLKLEAEVCYVKSTTLTIENVLDNLLYADAKNCALLKEAVMDYLVENGDEIMDKVSFDDVPGSVVKDLLAAVARGKMKDAGTSDITSNMNKMRVGTLRKMLHEKGLDVDGSREAMIARLKEHS